MNTTNIILIGIIAAILILAIAKGLKKMRGGCCSGSNYKVRKVKAASSDKKDYTYKITITVEGMTCTNCKIRVENAFNRKGYFAKVNLSKKQAIILSNSELAQEDASALVLKDGYTLTDYICEKL